jgi:translation initiation factor 2-alpha kinase 4
VMREVKSHARLNHHHVVRYYVTWVEAPPPGWQPMTDAMLAEKIGSPIFDPGWSATCSDSSVQGSRNEELSSDGIHSELPSLKASNGFFKSKGKEELSEFLYISMELCSGGTLKNWLETNKIRKPETTTKLFRQICSGIAYIHGQGLIHRDLKPQNIFLSDRKTVMSSLVDDRAVCSSQAAGVKGLGKGNREEDRTRHRRVVPGLVGLLGKVGRNGA